MPIFTELVIRALNYFKSGFIKRKTNRLEIEQIYRQIKAKDYKPIYLLHGEEPYYIDMLSNLFEEKVLNEGEKAFNLSILYGKETDFKTVVDNCRQFPMMARYRLVIVKEAQEMRDIKKLEKYAEQPSDQSILVINHKYKKLDQRSSFAKIIKKNAVVFESKKLYDNQLPQWIDQQLKKAGFKSNAAASLLLAEYLGNDLSKISNEINKLELHFDKGHTIDVAIIQEHIGISKEYNIFELQKALGERNAVKAFQIYLYFSRNPKKHPLLMIVASLYGYFMKIWLTQKYHAQNDNELGRTIGVYSSFFVKEYRIAAKRYSGSQLKHILITLKEFDLYSKGVDNRNTQNGQLVNELIYKILS